MVEGFRAEGLEFRFVESSALGFKVYGFRL